MTMNRVELRMVQINNVIADVENMDDYYYYYYKHDLYTSK